jgi:pseudaminic acid biosynthesis-associated methylase
MVVSSKQVKAWSSEFGDEYTDRNLMTTQDMDAMYLKQYRTSRTELNNLFIGHLNRDIKILEVGSNIGLQLVFLQNIGFKNLYGIEINKYAVELSKSKTKDINIIQGNALDIPFKNNYFDIVFTSGVLIHINPVDLGIVMNEIHRCSRRFIWGLEYYSNELLPIKYRNTNDLLWKANFPKKYMDSFYDLELVNTKKLKYIDSDNEDVMFLLRKET